MCEWNKDLISELEKLLLNEKLSQSRKILDYLYQKTLRCLKQNKNNKEKIIRKFQLFTIINNGSEFDYDIYYPFSD